MPSDDEEQGGGPCPLAKAVIPLSIRDCPGACTTLSTKDKPTAVSIRPLSHSQSWSTPHSTKPPILILESLHTKPKDGMKPPDSFAQAAMQPPSPDASKPTPAKVAIASTTSKLTSAVKRHQSNILSLLWSAPPGAAYLPQRFNV
jgi:hypothetical protein